MIYFLLMLLSSLLLLSFQSLHGLFHLDCWPWLLRLDISNNKLTSLSGCQLLPYLEELVANDNIIEEIGDEVTCLKSLTRLSLANNCILLMVHGMSAHTTVCVCVCWGGGGGGKSCETVPTCIAWYLLCVTCQTRLHLCAGRGELHTAYCILHTAYCMYN